MTGPAPKADAASSPAVLPAGYQRLFLRVTLWVLGAGAVVGAVLLLAGLYSGGGRVLATCFVAAVGAGFMALVSGWLDDRAKRVAGVAGTVVVIAAFACSVLAIWGDALGLWGNQTQYRFFGTVLSLVFVAGSAVVLMSFASVPLMRWSARVGVPALGVLLLCLLWALWGPAMARFDELILTMIWGVPCVIAAVVNHGLDRRHWRWLGVLAVVLLCVDHASMLLGNGSFLPSLIPLVWATAGSVAYVNVALIAVLPRWAAFLRWTAIVCAVGAAYLAAFLEPWNSRQYPGDDVAFRILAALSLIAACATIGLVVAWRLGSTRRWAARAEPFRSVLITCPRCAKRQTIALPESPCINCGLTFRVTMHDPRCAVCGYDTSGLTAPVCPECGSAVMLKSAWEKGPGTS
ncbi:MAG: hypothetical protein ACKVZJ_01250 [Phycisphaerales bacterium]